MGVIAAVRDKAPPSMPRTEPAEPIDREPVTPAGDACECAIKAIEDFKQYIAALERERQRRHAQRLAASRDPSSRTTRRVLGHLFSMDDARHRDVAIMARDLQIERRALHQHLQQLQDSGLAESRRESHRLGHHYWALTPRGCQFVVEHKLDLSPQPAGLSARMLDATVSWWRSTARLTDRMTDRVIDHVVDHATMLRNMNSPTNQDSTKP